MHHRHQRSLFQCMAPQMGKWNDLLKNLLSSFKLKQFADDNFSFDENGRKFSEQVENTVGKVEIALYEQFLLFPLCFQKTCTADT